LEDIIKQRIKDKAFDDVERKVKPTDHQYEYKKQLVLDQEKSKESLSKIYEKEYLKELEKLNPGAGDKDEEEEPKEHQEIRRKMKELFEKLDTLSSCFYTPKPAIPELKIITNLPTISMEEVAPVAVSDGNLLAPEEIKRRAIGDIIGKKERTKTDKNRERRKKKQFQKQKKVREEKSVAGKNNPKFQDKVDKEKMIRKVTKGRNVERMNESGADKASKSSKEFFNKLQDEVSNITQKIKSKKRKPEMGGFVAKKIKL
jgi:U3 small nucleolar RNA-associated protein MPP10